LETALTLARLHDGPAFRDHGSYGCMWIDPDDGPLAVGGRVGVGERSGDGAWRWSFLDSAIGRGAVAAPHKRPPVRWPGRGWQSESARIERVRRPKFSGGWSVLGRPPFGPGAALGSRSRGWYRGGGHT